VVDERFLFIEGEALARGDARELCDLTGWEGGVVDDLVEVGEELDLGACDCVFAGEVPEAGAEVG